MENNSKNINKYKFDRYDSSIAVGIIGRCDITTLSELIVLIKKLENFRIVNFRTSEQKLWIFGEVIL